MAMSGDGLQRVGQSGESTKGMVAQIIEIQPSVQEKAQAVERQSRPLEDVASAVIQVGPITQQNAAMVEQSLAAESEMLSDLLNYFARAKDAPGEHAQLAILGALAKARLHRQP